jgi:hypothetical protein
MGIRPKAFVAKGKLQILRLFGVGKSQKPGIRPLT